MVMSPVDLRAPDLERYPLFASVRFLNCTVGRGEMLYLPAFWWHEVQSAPDIADPAHPRNIGVNIWYAPVFDKAFPCRTCRPDLNPAYFDTVAKYI
jgi:jumonji domain-containing protein 7